MRGVHTQRPGRTTGCSRHPPAYAARPLPGAAEPQRAAAHDFFL